MDVSIIIVSWNVKDKLRANLQALINSSGELTREIFVVDNNSADGSAAMVAREFPEVRLLANSNNLGFAKANNQAIKLATGNFILLLNPDMQVRPDTLTNILVWAEQHPKATVSGCRLVDQQGVTIKQVRKFPTFWDQLMVTLKVPHFWPGVLNQYLCVDFNYEAPAKVDSIRGAFFLINRHNYRLLSGLNQPLLDERYFIWFEEVDFCRQVYQLGGEVWYTPSAVCCDYVGQSFQQVDTYQKQIYISESMIKYFLKWRPRWESFILQFFWLLVTIVIWLRY